MKRATKRKTRENPKPCEPITVMIVRHGDAGGERLPGEVGVPLTPRGRKQAARLGKRLASEKFDHIYASDLERARATAEAVVPYHKGTPFTITPDIREVHSYHTNYERNYGGRHLLRRLHEEHARAERFAKMLLRKHKPGDRVLVVAHGCLIRLLVSILCGLGPKQCPVFASRNTSVTLLHVWKDRRPSIVLANCVAHLTPQLVS